VSKFNIVLTANVGDPLMSASPKTGNVNNAKLVHNSFRVMLLPSLSLSCVRKTSQEAVYIEIFPDDGPPSFMGAGQYFSVKDLRKIALPYIQCAPRIPFCKEENTNAAKP
jgi:hypothetical protein